MTEKALATGSWRVTSLEGGPLEAKLADIGRSGADPNRQITLRLWALFEEPKFTKRSVWTFFYNPKQRPQCVCEVGQMENGEYFPKTTFDELVSGTKPAGGGAEFVDVELQGDRMILKTSGSRAEEIIHARLVDENHLEITGGTYPELKMKLERIKRVKSYYHATTKDYQ